ncbi:MAG: efflux RND transporter permease subunit [Thermodesulfobacteriota bacterium]|nr:efflux RND transporter permease subunit [Thermodesulfobacteriota bacterium]
MFLSDFSIKRPVAATMIVAALVIFGFIGMSRLGVSLFPDVDFPMITITTVWQNARPAEVDNEVTDEIEDAISTVSGIKHITSQSMQGRSRTTIEFELTKDIDVAAQEVRDKVSARLWRLPDDAEVPVINKLDINARPIMWLAITGQYAIEDLTKIADEQIRPLIQKIHGVGEIFIGGSGEKEIKIWLNRERLAAYNIGVEEVINAIRSQHIEIPGGKIESREKEFLIRTMGEFEAPRAFNDLIIAYRNGTPIRLGLIGYAESGREDSRAVARFTLKEGSQKSVGIGVAPRSGANQVAIAQQVKGALPEIRRILPEGARIHISSDNTTFIEQSIKEVQFHLIIGAIMAAFIIFIFLQNVRTTLISAVAIPTSIIATFACIYALDFTLNNMTMLALVTAVGLVIDDAIVVVENIFRHRFALGKTTMEASSEGSSEVAFAVVAATVTLAGVFIPVAYMGGIVGRFFFQFAITLAFAVACSLLVALTVVPMLSSRFLTLSNRENKLFLMFNVMMTWISQIYRRGISWFLKHRLFVLVIFILALVLGGGIFAILGKEFVTAEDQSQFLLRIETPLTYSIEKTDHVMSRLEKKLRAIPEIDHFFSIAGFGGGGILDSSKGVAFVSMTPKDERIRSQQDVQSAVRALIREFPDLKGGVTDFSPVGGASRNEDIQCIIQGPDIKAIDQFSREFMNRLSQIPGYVGVTRDLEIGKPEVRIRINREKAADIGVSVKDIASAVGALLGGLDMNPATYKEGGKSYTIRLRLTKDQRTLPEDVQQIWIRSKSGDLVDLSNFVDIEIGVGPNVINRRDRQRSATIYANLEGKLLGDAIPEIQRIAQEVLPDGYSVKLAGRAEAFSETFSYIAFAFILAIVLTYMVLASQFESFTQPFAIMMGLPLSFVGAFGLLFIVGNTFNLFSMIGLVLLVGLVTKNGILLIDYTNQLRAKGMSVHDALVEAGGTRLRPILMTAVSTIAGIIPVALGIGVGSESRQPLAIAIAGGMISSTFLTLVVIPVVYSYLDQFAEWKLFLKFKEKIMATDQPKLIEVEE